MKKILLFAVIALIFSSCWSSEDKEIFRDACLEDARRWAGSEENANTYCNCVLEKIVKKYPDENDAMEHINDIIHDTALTNCKKLIGK